MRKKIKKDICFIACTHGDEPVGKTAVEKIEKDKTTRKPFAWIIGNEKAMALGQRFTDHDLNRVAPGDPKSSSYEIKRAHELLKSVRRYKYVIDLHQTLANDRIVIILPKLTPRTLALACAFPIKDILYWPSSDPKAKTGPLTKYLPRAIEVESGTKTSYAKTEKKLQKILKEFLASSPKIQAREKQFEKKISLPDDKRFFFVNGKIQADEVDVSKLEDFKTIKAKTGSFVPLLFGRHQGLIGYKMQRIDQKWILAHTSR